MTKSLKNTGSTVVKDLIPFISEHTLNAICGIVSHFYNYIYIYIYIRFYSGKKDKT